MPHALTHIRDIAAHLGIPDASLESYGESTPYISAAAVLLVTLLITVGLRLGNGDDVHPAPSAA